MIALTVQPQFRMQNAPTWASWQAALQRPTFSSFRHHRLECYSNKRYKQLIAFEVHILGDWCSCLLLDQDVFQGSKCEMKLVTALYTSVISVILSKLDHLWHELHPPDIVA